MHTKNVLSSGKPVTQAKKALIMLHGRGASAEDIISISDYLNLQDFAILAPRAENNSWYPNSFLTAPEKNEPWLTDSLNLISEIINDLNNYNISNENIYFLGFSQGACLALEYSARNAREYGGIVAFSGGLIGDRIYKENYSGDYRNTPVFIGTSDPDPHIPVERVNDSYNILKNMKADIVLKKYKNMGHTINEDEIDTVNSIIFKDVQVNQNMQ